MVKNIIELRNTVKYVNNQFVSFYWKIFWVAMRTSPSLRVVASNYNDEHLNTALKRILKRYE